MIHNCKKTRMVVFLLLLALVLGSCKTKEKVTMRQVETAQAVSSSVSTESQHTERNEQTTTTEEAVRTSLSDSIFERFHERIVTDYTGRVLLHEQEHTKDHFKGNVQIRTKRNGSSRETVTGNNTELTSERNDSTYKGGILSEVTVVKKKPFRWLWPLLLSGSLLTAGFIVSKIIRR